MENLLVWGFYFLSLYAFIPGLVSRLFGFRVFKKGLADKEIALTFDDGPDPVYTPRLLDLLARHDARATFFVVGAHAERHPELLQRMRDEGHTIGIHNYVHKTNWIMRPKTVKRQIALTADVIKRATGQAPSLYRPPWGIVNLFDFSKKGQYKIVLWSGIFGDWKSHENSKKLKNRLVKKLKPGEVLLLHDCGLTLGADKDAPAQMLEALQIYLEEGTARNYRFVTIPQLIELTEKNKANRPSWWNRALAALWLQYENLFHLVFRLKAVKAGDGGKPVFHYRKVSYSGPPIELREGVRIVKGDKVAEIHLDNSMLRQAALRSSSPVAVMIRLLRQMDHALPAVSKAVLNDPEMSTVKALYGVTMIHSGTDKLGFQLFDLPDNWFAKVSRLYLKLLFRVLSAKPKKKPTRSSSKKERGGPSAMYPRMLFMSRRDMESYRSTAAPASQNAEERNEMPLSVVAGETPVSPTVIS
ncbi:polysaccharide deacetylase family protein [Paenibacillus pasadenensis]|uniref:polysaccharide deacetylase family protein n=1 Tax=Paenibacillus pasadenensis TaxID=217090 RepID=UPI00203EB4C6|nr:polysaccharide deacetylase family protein [Paenibacillus pasadenensis]MCM3746632.1 polysaccharide deacetylase family protein [Paenibacillus pasadenensis]